MDSGLPQRLLSRYARPIDDPVADADRYTSLADACTAWCISKGVALDDIDSASGHNYSRDAYLSFRAFWVNQIKYHGLSGPYLRPRLDAVFANWVARRPGFTAGDDWAAAGIEAHRAYWGGLGRVCTVEDCVLHAEPGSWQIIGRYSPGSPGLPCTAGWSLGDPVVLFYDAAGTVLARAAAPTGADTHDVLTIMLTQGDLTGFEQCIPAHTATAA